MSEGLRSPDGLYAHKPPLGRDHPYCDPVTVAFLSKPNPSVNGSSCGNHFAPSYGYIASNASGCYHHEFDYGYGMCNGAPPAHSMLNSNQMRNHLQPNNSLGKPPNEADEDAYLEQNPEERENYEKKNGDDNLLDATKYGCVQCGHMRDSNLPQLTNINHSATEIHPTNQCCGCDCTNMNNLASTTNRDQFAAGDSLNGAVGIRDMIDCVTPATTTTTTCGRTSSGNTTTNEEEDDEQNKSSPNESSNLDSTDLKEEHLSNLLTQATNNLHTSFIKQTDLGSEDDSNEDTSDEHIAILNRKTRKDQIKKWRSSTETAISNPSSATTSSSVVNSSPTKNNIIKSNIPLLIESQPEQFQIA